MDAIFKTVLALIQITFWLMLAGLGLLCAIASWHQLGVFALILLAAYGFMTWPRNKT